MRSLRTARVTALVTAPPLLLAAAGLVHPRHLTPVTAGDWAGLHIVLLPVFPSSSSVWWSRCGGGRAGTWTGR